jgi:hypothetical protein
MSQSVIYEMATVQECERSVVWLFETKSVTQTQRNYGPLPWPPRSPDITPLDFSCGVMSRAMCSEHQLTDLMT